MRKGAEGVCTLETRGLNPRSGVHRSVPCKSISGGPVPVTEDKGIYAGKLKDLRQKPNSLS